MQEYLGWKMSLNLLKFSWLLCLHYKLWKPVQISFLILPGWHTVENHQWLTVCYIKSLITLLPADLEKHILTSCQSTVQCCQLTPFTVSTPLVHTSLISAAKPLKRNLVKKTHRALQILSALTGCGESPEHSMQSKQIIPINIGKSL